METIKECAVLYKELLGKKYIFTLEGDYKFTIEFTPSNFYHLLGLEKLTDIDQIINAKPGKVFKSILSGDISERLINNSKHYALIKDRITYFDNLPDLLHFSKSNKIIVDFDINKLSFSSKLSNTKFILYKRTSDRICHLTIGQRQTLYPETYIIECSGQYLSEQTLLDIENIEIVERKSKKNSRSKTKE